MRRSGRKRRWAGGVGVGGVDRVGAGAMGADVGNGGGKDAGRGRGGCGSG